MLTTLTGSPIGTQLIPPEGHSISTPLTANNDKKGRTSPGGPLCATTTSPAYTRFLARMRLRESVLNKTQSRDQLVERVKRRLDALDTYLSDDEAWFSKLEKANLRDVAIFEGVYIDKLQALTGHANQIIGVQHQQKIDQLLPMLMQAMQQRGLHLTATERKIEMTQG